MQKLKQLLEHWPHLYHILHKIYLPLALKYIAFRRYLNRNRLDELWATGYFRRGKTTEPFSVSINHPHRSFIVGRVGNFSPISSILEIGCDTGPNLYLLAKKFPNAEIKGVDINPQAVNVGNDWFTHEGISNVKLSVGRAEELGEFQDKSIDVVLTVAVLIYVSRDKTYETIKEMIRIARKGLILVELHDFGQQLNDTHGFGVYTNGLWVRDYMVLLKQFVPAKQIHIMKITEDIWADEGWRKNGAVFEVTLY